MGTRRDSLAAVYAAQMRPDLRDALYRRVLEARRGEDKEFKVQLLGSLLRFLPTDGEGSVYSILGSVMEGALENVGGKGSGEGEEGWGAQVSVSWGERCAADLRAQAQAFEFAASLPSLCASFAPSAPSPLAAVLPSAAGASQMARQLALRNSLILSLCSG